MSHADYDDPLYKECINVRITPTPPTTDGPTAQWQAALRRAQIEAGVTDLRDAS